MPRLSSRGARLLDHAVFVSGDVSRIAADDSEMVPWLWPEGSSDQETQRAALDGDGWGDEMTGYYNRQGEPISLEEFSERHKTEFRVAETTIGDKWISTVWLGRNHRFADGPPLIFETMVFQLGEDGKVSSWCELDADRYSTEEEALAGHNAIVAKYSEAPR